ncbi:MAG TPA: LuxR family transcriptional regulator [Burkholderiaceae bacterium]|jgi:DNA-binding CsgD family transcriptional regulator
MLEPAFQSVLRVKTREEFRGEVVRFAQDLGFDTVSATMVIDRSAMESDFDTVDNTPIAWSKYFQDRSTWRVDPVMQHCKRQSVPIVWNQDTYVASGHGDLWEEQAQFGYRSGICMALHLPEGRHFLLGVDCNNDLPDKSSTLTRLVADLQLFAVYAQDTAWRVVMPDAGDASSIHVRLTPRELECLRWTMDGKTAWEVGGILSITERTVVLHLSNAMRKLDCHNKHQAVLKALRLGLIR